MGSGTRADHIDWYDWSLNWAVEGTEGLCLTEGTFRGRQIFRKLSLPVIRVKYVLDEQPVLQGGVWQNPIWGTGCGPYNDQITWDTEDIGDLVEDLTTPYYGPHHLVKQGGSCGNSYVCVRELQESGDNTLWLQLGVYARIGAYHIVQNWNLHNSGIIAPQVFSKGLSCTLDHRHHPYWRFDFDLDGPGHQNVLVFDGADYKGTCQTEGYLLNANLTYPRYLIRNNDTGLNAWIIPPTLDAGHGVVGPDQFSRFDGYVRLFRSAENIAWPHPPEHDINFASHEPLHDWDSVFWSICHLHHRAGEGADHWHGIGPTIVIDTSSNQPFVGEFPVVYPDRQEMAIRDFRFTAGVAADEGFVGGYPNFHTATYGRNNVGGTIFLKSGCSSARNVSLTDLGGPELDDFAAMFRAVHQYATDLAFVGGFPNFLHAQQRVFSEFIGGKKWVSACGIVLIKPGCAEWRDVPLADLNNPALSDIGARFRATNDYAFNRGFVSGFPTFIDADYGSGVVCGTVLLKHAAAEWRDVLLWLGPT
jgi:hypothetical protein